MDVIVLACIPAMLASALLSWQFPWLRAGSGGIIYPTPGSPFSKSYIYRGISACVAGILGWVIGYALQLNIGLEDTTLLYLGLSAVGLTYIAAGCFFNREKILGSFTSIILLVMAIVLIFPELIRQMIPIFGAGEGNTHPLHNIILLMGIMLGVIVALILNTKTFFLKHPPHTHH
jgi:hypothetical protein